MIIKTLKRKLKETDFFKFFEDNPDYYLDIKYIFEEKFFISNILIDVIYSYTVNFNNANKKKFIRNKELEVQLNNELNKYRMLKNKFENYKENNFFIHINPFQQSTCLIPFNSNLKEKFFAFFYIDIQNPR